MTPGSDGDRAALSLFADELKATRAKRGWSQEDLAAKIPYSPSTIGMVEALHRAPTRDLALRQLPQGVGVFFVDGNDVADESESGLTASRHAIADVQEMSWSGNAGTAYVQLVGKQTG